MRKLFVLFAILNTLWLLQACTEVKVPLNPNGDSELALLMRDMYDEGMLMKTGLENGKRIKGQVGYKKILTAVATEPEKAASSEYKAFAAAYIAAMEQLNASDYPEYDHAYVKMVDACADCHKALCPGPLVKIEKLTMKGLNSD